MAGAHGWLVRHAACLPALVCALVLAAAAQAEQAWVKDELKLNIRTGPGVQYRIVSSLETGDLVEILDRTEGWTKVRVRGSEEGWIPGGYLQPTPPARVALARRQEETADLEQRVETLSAESADLRREYEAVAGRDEQQRAEITRLTQENMRLRAGARWPEWIAGAGLLASGMLLGALLHRNTTRRRAPRIRL